MRATTALLTGLFLAVKPSFGGDLASGVERGQEALYQLDYAAAEKIFQKLADEFPNDPTGYAFLAITYWNQLLRAAGNLATDDYATPTPFTKGKTHKPIDEETKRFRDANDKVIDLCDQILEEDPKHVKALYFKGVAHENFAGEAIAITKSSGRAFTHGRKAKGLHEQVLELEPTFVDAKVSIAVYEFAKATLPWSIKWITFLLGMRGDKEKALANLQEVIDKGVYRSLDAQVVMALLHSWKGDANEAIRIFKSLARQFPMNYLIDINMAAIYETALNDRESALRIYQSLAEDLENKAPGLASGEVYYRIGKTQFYLRDYSMALESFKRARRLPQGESETSPLCSYYMAQIYLQKGDTESAIEHYGYVEQYKGPKEALKDEKKTAGKQLKKLRK